MPTLTDESRENYRTRGNTATIEELKTGALQRIATALERLADREDKSAELAALREEKIALVRRAQTAERSAKSLRGHVTRLRNKMA